MEVLPFLSALLTLLGSLEGRLPDDLDSGYKGRRKHKQELIVAAPLALTDVRGDTPSSVGVLPAINLAVRKINRDKSLLQRYNFSVLTQDTKVSFYLIINILDTQKNRTCVNIILHVKVNAFVVSDIIFI